MYTLDDDSLFVGSQNTHLLAAAVDFLSVTMDSAHLLVVQSSRSKPKGSDEHTDSNSSPKRALDPAVAAVDSEKLPGMALSPPPLPTASPTPEILAADIQRCLFGVEMTSRVIAQRFDGLVSASVNHLETVARATGDHCDMMLQAANYVDFQVEHACRCGSAMLEGMIQLNNDMNRAKSVLADIQDANLRLAAVEKVLAEMEQERGLAPLM